MVAPLPPTVFPSTAQVDCHTLGQPESRQKAESTRSSVVETGQAVTCPGWSCSTSGPIKGSEMTTLMKWFWPQVLLKSQKETEDTGTSGFWGQTGDWQDRNLFILKNSLKNMYAKKYEDSIFSQKSLEFSLS